MKAKYLIELEGGGDTERFRVGEATWNWINSDPPDFEDGHSAEEVVPDDVKQEAFEKDKVPEKVRVTSGSFDNDRALAASLWSKQLNSSRGHFEDFYEGYIY